MRNGVVARVVVVAVIVVILQIFSSKLATVAPSCAWASFDEFTPLCAAPKGTINMKVMSAMHLEWQKSERREGGEGRVKSGECRGRQKYVCGKCKRGIQLLRQCCRGL